MEYVKSICDRSMIDDFISIWFYILIFFISGEGVCYLIIFFVEFGDFCIY